ncbi:hypothetical protein F3J24_04050 [Comamonas sp. Tr-654]|uniref:hypothetical protein n=1 Tax=Comamonas sp. Tr-654 TaxID=2608341 RepID=UPI001421B27E|nr:hypothetical protein [Comamonas sp. Tr-654]NIF82682.1 hypothetical protein [Comamonas sp. Tr-654]
MVYLQITLKVGAQNRAADVYSCCREPLLKTVWRGWSTQLFIRHVDVQVLQSLDSGEHSQTYLTSELFDVVVELSSSVDAAPDVLILDAHSAL